MQQVRDILKLLNPLANITNLNIVDEFISLKKFEQKINVKPSQLAVLFLIVVLLFIASFFIKISNIFVWLFCYFFPAYFTLIALKNRNQQACKKYLIYWLLFPLVLNTQTVVKMFFNRTIFKFLRVISTILLLNPQMDISNRFLESFIRPFLQDEKIKKLTGELDSFFKKGKQKIEEMKNKIQANNQTNEQTTFIQKNKNT